MHSASYFTLKNTFLCSCSCAKPSTVSHYNINFLISTSRIAFHCHINTKKMSSRRSRSKQSGSSRISEDQINELVSKLQQLLPAEIQTNRSDKTSAAKILQETCNYIRSLHREVDGLSERLSELLETSDTTQAALLRSLLMQ